MHMRRLSRDSRRKDYTAIPGMREICQSQTHSSKVTCFTCTPSRSGGSAGGLERVDHVVRHIRAGARLDVNPSAPQKYKRHCSPSWDRAYWRSCAHPTFTVSALLSNRSSSTVERETQGETPTM